MTEEAGANDPHLREAKYSPRMVTKDDTNLKLLMADYERLSKLDSEDDVVKSAVDYCFKPCSYVNIQGHTIVTLNDLTNAPNEFHQRRFFVCRTITAFIRSHCLLTVVETPDPSKEYQGTFLSLSNNIRPVEDKSKTCYSFLSPGTIVVVKNPLYTKSSYDSFYTVNCDNPGDVGILEEEIFCELFPDLKWPSREPQCEESYSLIKQWWRWLWSKTTNDWKKVAELRLENKNYRGALQAYEFALGSNPKDTEIMTLRGGLYLKLKVYQKSLKDSESILEIEEGNRTAIYSKALSFIGLGRYKLAHEFLETHIEKVRFSGDADHESELLNIQSKAKTWSRQEECGEYDTAKFFECPTSYSHDCANYFGNVRLQDIVGKGRGVVATADIQCGELLMAEKAFSTVQSNDLKFNTALVPTSVNKVYIQWKLISYIADRLRLDPDLGKELYKLYDGTTRSVSEQTEDVEEYDKIDMRRISRICNYNVFSTTTTSGKDDFLDGLWLFASYLNHNCYDANCVTLISGDFLLIRACKNIKKNEEISISYVLNYMPYPERLSALSKYGFVCKCSLCQLDAKDSDAIHIRRQELLAEISKIKPESRSQCLTMEKLITKLTSLRLKDPKRNILILKPLIELANCYEKLRDYERAANIYHSVQNLSSGTTMIDSSFLSSYNVLLCYMCSGKTQEASRCVGAFRTTLIQSYGTDSEDIMNFVSKDLAMMVTLCEMNQ